MPEGHTIHRAAGEHRRLLVGHDVSITSPQGRFDDGAALLDGKACRSVEAFGKHLFYGFDGALTLHVHLGLFGRIRKQKLPARPPRGAVRVRLIGPTHLIDINGPTICTVRDPESVNSIIGRIGPDLIRDEADPERAFRRIEKSRAPIGKLLMDQSVIAGIGNIYRTEILWRQGIHPDIPGRSLSREQLEKLWADAKALLAIGVRYNAIITVDDLPKGRRRLRERVNIFGKPSCPRCAAAVTAMDIAGRRAFICETCQPL
ncbi:MAG: DNA-formamidopyrimidine glycosylase family protein [Pseudomonadota bacterium]